MTIDERLLTAAIAAGDEIAAAQHQVDVARAGFQRTVRALYLNGGSLREIADRLGLSHQRVHQLLDVPVWSEPSAGPPSGGPASGPPSGGPPSGPPSSPPSGPPSGGPPSGGSSSAKRTSRSRRRRGTAPCSFCGQTQAQAGKLIFGAGGVAICDLCVALSQSSLASNEPACGARVTLAVQPAPGRCPFCGKHTGVELAADHGSALRLVTAPGGAVPGSTAAAAAICEECVDLCVEIIADTASA